MSDARALPPARLDVAWTFASSALEGPQGWSTSALRLECSWEADVPAGTPARARCVATVERAGRRTDVELPAGVDVVLDERGPWTHVDVRIGEEALVSASFQRGRLAYCLSSLPRRAGLGGGTHDPPTGILELYRRAAP